MDRIYKYTTRAAISRRLRGRLEVSGSPLIGSAGAGKVDPELIDSLAHQIEARIDIALGQIYRLPISADCTAALFIVGSIVEKLIVSEIALTHFQYVQNPQTGGDMGFGSVIRKQALEELESLLHGHGVYIPGVMNPPNPLGIQQPLILPDVMMNSDRQMPDSFSRNYSVVGKRETLKAWEIEF
jgi:hypothetical protein